MCGSQLPEEAVEPAWHGENQNASFTGYDTPLRVGKAARREDDASGMNTKLVVSNLEDVLALEDVEELVISVVNVERRVDQRRKLLEEAERPAGRGRRRSDENRHFAEDEAFAFVCLERVPRRVVMSHRHYNWVDGAPSRLTVRTTFPVFCCVSTYLVASTTSSRG